MTVVLPGFANINICGAAVCWVAFCCTRSQVSTPSTAVGFLKLYDGDVKANREAHRASQYVAGQGKMGGCEVRWEGSPRAGALLRSSVRSLWLTAYALSMKHAWKLCIETSAIFHTGQPRPT